MKRGCGSGPSNPPSSLPRRSSRAMAPSSRPTPSASRASTSPTTALELSSLLISLANTAEPLYLVNRSGNRPSQEQAEPTSTRRLASVAGLASRKILLRGDTKFTQCTHLDRWDGPVTPFVFGIGRHGQSQGNSPTDLPPEAYSFLERPPRYEIKTAPPSNPNGSSSRSSGSEGSRPFTYSRRWSPSSSIAPSPATEELSGDRRARAAGERTKGRCGCSRSIATSSISPTTA